MGVKHTDEESKCRTQQSAIVDVLNEFQDTIHAGYCRVSAYTAEFRQSLLDDRFNKDWTHKYQLAANDEKSCRRSNGRGTIRESHHATAL